MKISIVIPTYNEEKYLPKLLESIKKQTFKDYEIIVADANSKDKTRKIAEKYGAKIVEGGIPSIGRNNGAKIAKGEYIYFLDADIKLPKNFLKNTFKEMIEKKLDIATCSFRPISPLELDKILHKLVNIIIKLSSFTKKPYTPGFCILVKKEIHNKIKGFDTRLKLREDHDYVQRAINFGRFGFLESTYFYVSVRRLKKEGRLNLAKMYLSIELYSLINGKITDENFNYEFGNFDKKTRSKIDAVLIRIEKKLKKIKNKYIKNILTEKVRLLKNFIWSQK